VAIDREKVLSAAQKFVEKKKYDKAVVEYQKLIQEDPNDARTLLKIGDLQSKMEAYDGAVATYERVGKQYAQQGFALKAIAVYKQIREIIAKHVPQLEERYAHIAPKLAELYQQLGLTSDALAALDEVATRFQRQGRDAEGIDVFRKIVELDPTNPLPHLRLAEALSRVKDADGAVQEFGVAAAQLMKLGRRDDALKVFERLLHHKNDPAHARIAAELYLARNQQNDGLQALAKLQLCFQANPKDLDTLALLARAFTAIGQAAKAVEVQKEMARIAKEQGKTELFKQLLEKLLRLAPNDEGVRQLASAPIQQVTMSSAPPPMVEEPPTRGRAQPQQAQRAQPVVHDEPPRGARIDELSYEAVSTGDIVEPEEPFEMRGRSGQEAASPEAADEFDQDESPSLSTDVVIEDSYQPIEEVGAHNAPDVRTQLARILADATSFRRARFTAKAVETLRAGLELAPRSLELRETLRDVLLEGGRNHEAVGEMLSLASLQIDSLDGDGAAQTLQDVLAIDPQNMRAAEMLRELGYELVEEQAPSVSPSEFQDYDAATGLTGSAALENADDLPPMRGEYASYDPEAPLPSYDLEEIGPEDVAPRAYSDPMMRAAPPAEGSTTAQTSLADIDDPFADGPLPSFPLDAPPESEAAFDLVATRDGDDEYEEAAPRKMAVDSVKTDAAMRIPSPLPDKRDSESPTAAGPKQRQVASTPPQATATEAPAPAVGAELEEALEEADFFATRGLYDDARTILEEQLARLPSHPLLVERLAELEAQERGVALGSGTREKPNGTSYHPSAGPGIDRSFDIAETLGALDEEPRPAEGHASGTEQQVDVEEVFAKFKEGVAKQISVDDGQAHYDLGLAYREMGLIDDAIREFEVAARDLSRECVCQSMIGTIQIERGNLNEAIDAFMRGLHSKMRTPEQEMVLCFEIGAAYEAKKMAKEAINYFSRVARRDPNYRDVQDRMRRLQGTVKAPARAAAVGADDEFDRAFDDILGGSKLP
jgi:tetratricopeptide (TPR) repeat protein